MCVCSRRRSLSASDSNCGAGLALEISSEECANRRHSEDAVHRIGAGTAWLNTQRADLGPQLRKGQSSLQPRGGDDRDAPAASGWALLERDDFSSNRHPALAFCWSMIFSENRCPLFGIML